MFICGIFASRLSGAGDNLPVPAFSGLSLALLYHCYTVEFKTEALW